MNVAFAQSMKPAGMTNRDGCDFQPVIEDLRRTLGEVLCGKAEVVERVLICLLARGHLLIEDLPGLGKTTLAKAIAHAVNGRCVRVQCTPDLLPSDITGFNVFNQKTREFEFQEGPVFSDILLVDEINRATPRTQSALLEAMAERQVTIDKVCHPLSDTFFLIATQNPMECHGVYPLPEAQLDRFAMKLSIGYPDMASEVEILGDAIGRRTDRSSIPAVMDLSRLRELQEHVARLAVAKNVRGYMVEVARVTRSHPRIRLGVSPRGLLIWQSLSQARAHLQGRDFVIPDDVQYIAKPTLSVRMVGDPDFSLNMIDEIIGSVPVPVFA